MNILKSEVLSEEQYRQQYPDERKLIISKVSKYLDLININKQPFVSREEQIKIACQIFDLLCTPEGKRFTLHYDRFARVVLDKLKQFYYIQKIPVFKKYAKYLFGIEFD